MITKAIIEQKVDDFRYKVRIPIFNKSKNVLSATPTEELDIAPVCTMPGCHVNYQVGDVVFVGFDDSEKYEPIILGMLYRKEDTGTLMSITAESIITTISSNLSKHTSIGGLSEEKLQSLAKAHTSSGGSSVDIPLATQTHKGLMSPEDKIKLDNAVSPIDFSSITGFHTLTIGDQVFDGLHDVTIPVYKGEMGNLRMTEVDEMTKESPMVLQMESN